MTGYEVACRMGAVAKRCSLHRLVQSTPAAMPTSVSIAFRDADAPVTGLSACRGCHRLLCSV